MKPVRLLHIPNEVEEGDQIGPRKAFLSLYARGDLSAYSAYSYLVERRRARNHADALRSLYEAAEAFRPDIIFWQHLNRSYPVDREFLHLLKGLPSRPRLVWHEGDVYGRIVKRIDRVTKAVAAECDLAVITGLGDFASRLRRHGAKRILYAPQSFDDERFDQPWQAPLTRRFDAIMIANLTCLKRIPWLYMPGGRKRKILSRLFYSALGDRYAVFGAGRGWRGEPYCRGPIPYRQQEEVMRSSWLTITWGHFDGIPMYSSDRLPNSLASGVPHIANYQPGYEHVFPDAKGIYFVDSPLGALDVACVLLSKPREELIEIGRQGASYARERLNATRVYHDIFRAIQQQLLGQP